MILPLGQWPLATARVGDCFSDALLVGAKNVSHLATPLVVNEDVRDGTDVVFLRQLALLVDVDLLQRDVGIAFRDLFEDRADVLTRTAPISIEIDNCDFAMLGLDGSPDLRTRIGLGSRRGFGPGRRWLRRLGVRAAGGKIGHLNSGNVSWLAIQDAYGK